MNRDYFKSYTLMSNEMQKPFQDILALQLRTLKNLKYLRLEELANFQEPSKFLGKQVNLVLENGHNIFDCMQKSCQILEHAFLVLSKEMQEQAKPSFEQAVASMMAEANKSAEAFKASSKTASRPRNIKINETATEKKTAKPKSNAAAKKMKASELKKAAPEKKTVAKKRRATVSAKANHATKAARAEKRAKPESRSSAASARSQGSARQSAKINLSKSGMEASDSKVNMPASRSMAEGKLPGSDVKLSQFEMRNPIRK